ncbi:hypothetical protein BN2476_650082 [Paraburkholderia piptadeniae]|uniref:Uncharacterized protein n=1 Tax=Paraburkholderia piptadeniae TaxID=1701573 RepID=A0A1N7SND6_9BURK|nr:hypothetical protein [Paraburkholderia piptadeniae]SIT48837.1 hypothetical protein BN2476_650082 [Paraburkholderia piptadeniae]
MQDSTIFPSKFFFRGSEDLGGGMRAMFGLDSLSKRTKVYLTSVYRHINGAYAAEIGNTVSNGKVHSVTELGMLTTF